MAYSACWVCGNSNAPLVEVVIDRTKRRVCGDCAEMYKPKPPITGQPSNPITKRSSEQASYSLLKRPLVITGSY